MSQGQEMLASEPDNRCETTGFAHEKGTPRVRRGLEANRPTNCCSADRHEHNEILVLQD